MNKAFVYILIICISSSASTQNLVMNPSFEEYYQCPSQGAQINRCKSVFNPLCPDPDGVGCGNTSDYFNNCDPLFSVPFVIGGYQYPREGNAFIGMVSSVGYQEDVNAYTSGIREATQIKLTKEMVAGKNYHFSFYINLANTSDFTTKGIGVKFVKDSTIYSNVLWGLWEIMQPDWVSNTYITDTLGWQSLSGNHIANGGEAWMIITDFSPDGVHKFLPYAQDTSGGSMYYYIDGVSVEKRALKIPNVFTPNDDGINDNWIINSNNINQVIIYNRWRNEVFKAGESFNGWNGNNKNGKPCTDGTYFYIVTTSNEYNDRKETYSGFITLLR